MPPIRSFATVKNSIAILAAAALLLAACAPAATQTPAPATVVPVTGNNLAPTATLANAIPESVTPAVKVSDQAVSGGEVTVDQVDSPGPGWIVIHINDAGKPGPIIGWSPVKAGVNPNVKITVDASKATSVLYAMLHVDAGQVGTYEFPGPDAPLTVNGQMVNPAFAATGGAGGSGDTGGATAAATTAPSGGGNAAPAATNTTAASSGYGTKATAAPTTASGDAPAAGQATVNIIEHPQLGKILVDSKGMTLYIFKKDTPGASNCTGGCLENWPPLLATGPIQAGAGVGGQLTVFTRADNGTQVLYNNQPLYFFAGDQAPGDVNGQGVGDVWFAAVP